MSVRFAYNNVVHAPFIAQVVSITACSFYLELGVAEGHNIHEVVKCCKNCVGVDSVDTRIYHDFEFHLKTTDDFFKNFNSCPDVIFIDAAHIFEQVKMDFINSLKHLSEHGIILLHDTDPMSMQFLDRSACGDAYKMHDWLKQTYPELNVITLPITIAGITMVNREKDRRLLKFFRG